MWRTSGCAAHPREAGPWRPSAPQSSRSHAWRSGRPPPVPNPAACLHARVAAFGDRLHGTVDPTVPSRPTTVEDLTLGAFLDELAGLGIPPGPIGIAGQGRRGRCPRLSGADKTRAGFMRREIGAHHGWTWVRLSLP